MADLARMIVDEAASQAKELGHKRAVKVDVKLHNRYHRELLVLPLADHLLICYKAAVYKVSRTDNEGRDEVMTVLADRIECDAMKDAEVEGDDVGMSPLQLIANEFDYLHPGEVVHGYTLTATQLGEEIYSKRFQGQPDEGLAPGLQAALKGCGNILRYIV